MSLDEPLVDGGTAISPSTSGGAPPERTQWLGLVVLGGLLLFLGLSYSWFAVLMVGALAVCIFLHELGHYLTAKAAGMKVTEFFLGFGPPIWSFRRGETQYGIKPIMVGAYVRIIGMSNLEQVDPADEDRTYRSKPYWRRLSVAVAGSTMHLLIALVLIFTVFVGFGVNDDDASNWTVYVQPDSPAAAAGLRDGDHLVSIDGLRLATFADASQYLRSRPGETVDLVVDRDGGQQAITVTLALANPSTGEHVGYLGVGPHVPRVRLGVVEGVGRSVSETRSAIWQSITGIRRLFSPSGVENYYDHVRGTTPPASTGTPDQGRPTSIVGIVQVGSQVAEDGLVNLVYLLFFLNVFIGVFNLSPLLPFDGGHVVIATYEKVRSLITRREYRADVAKLMPLTYAVVAVLAVLFLTSTFMDVSDPLRIR